MSKIIVFLLMFCFSYSISFADTEKWDSEKEKRFKAFEAKNKKMEEEDEFRQKIMEDAFKKQRIETDRALENMKEHQRRYEEVLKQQKEHAQQEKDSEKAAPILPLRPVQSVDSLVDELNGLLNFKTNKDLPYIPITNEQKNEITNLGFNKMHPSEEIAELVRNTVDDSFEKLDSGTFYELYHRDTINELIPTAIKFGVGIVHSNIITGAMVWSTGPRAVLVTITSGVHKGELVFIPAWEYGSNLKHGKRITAN